MNASYRARVWGDITQRPTQRTTHFDYNPGKNFHDMYAQFKTMIETGEVGTFASADDGIIATRIAREATESIAREMRANKG